jgi:hypothetical protein
MATDTERRQMKYVNTAPLRRELAYLKRNREAIEAISLCLNLANPELFPPFDYHGRRREILKVLAARAARKAA